MSEKYRIPEDVSAEVFLEHFGAKPQMIKALEELAECSVRIAKDLNGDGVPPYGTSSYDSTVEEIADALIMLRQMRILYGWEAVDQAMAIKALRTKRYIKSLKR